MQRIRIRGTPRLYPHRGPRRAAFSLIELVTVIAIIGMLLALSVPAILSMRQASRTSQCRNHLKILGEACQSFHRVHGHYPRNTIRPRGSTPVDGEPPGSLWNWHKGTFESWHREIMEHIGHAEARVQDAVPELGCNADPRGIDYTVPDYGFTWYVGVYTNRVSVNDGVIIDDSDLKKAQTVNMAMVIDGLANTILIAERPPSTDGRWGWWDSRCCIDDNVSPVVGNNKPYSSGKSGKCPNPTRYEQRSWEDRCAFNSIWSFHPEGANFCMADGSVRTISYELGNQPNDGETLLESLASRAGREIANLPAP